MCSRGKQRRKEALPDAERYHHWPALPGQQSGAPVRPAPETGADHRLYCAAVCSFQSAGPCPFHSVPCSNVQGGKNSRQNDHEEPEAHPAHRDLHSGAEPVLCVGRGRTAGAHLVFDHLCRGCALCCADGSARHGAHRGHQPAHLHHQPHRAHGCHRAAAEALGQTALPGARAGDDDEHCPALHPHPH